jgi:hypothetical protein
VGGVHHRAGRTAVGGAEGDADFPRAVARQRGVGLVARRPHALDHEGLPEPGLAHRDVLRGHGLAGLRRAAREQAELQVDAARVDEGHLGARVQHPHAAGRRAPPRARRRGPGLALLPGAREGVAGQLQVVGAVQRAGPVHHARAALAATGVVLGLEHGAAVGVEQRQRAVPGRGVAVADRLGAVCRGPRGPGDKGDQGGSSGCCDKKGVGVLAKGVEGEAGR